jgi:hypothetical protein
MLESSAFEMAVEKIRSQKSPGTDQIPELINARVEQLALKSINLLILSGHGGII